jgi:hypothetical protein
MHPAALTSPCGVRSTRASDVRVSHRLGRSREERLVGEARSPRRVSPNVEEVPNAWMPIWPGSPRPSPAKRGRGEPGTDLGLEALVLESALA